MTAKTKAKKIISSLLIVLILLPGVLFSVPEKALAVGPGSTAAASVPTADIPAETAGWLSKALHAIGVPATVAHKILAAKDWAQKVLMEAAKAAAMKALQDMTKSTINWIAGGYHGMPLFLENPESFFKDIEQFEVRTLVDLYGYDQIKYPFGKEFALNTIYAYRSQNAANNAYSLGQYINDPVLIKNYQNDFSVGGWDGFMLNTGFSQNNYIGFQMLANEELAGKIQGVAGTAKDKVNKLLDQGMGFLSPQICQTNSSYNNMYNEFNAPSFNRAAYEKKYQENMPYCADDNNCTEEELARIAQYREDYTIGLAAAQDEWAKTNTCPPQADGSSGLKNTTPGAVVANQIIKSVQAPANLKEQAINSGSLIVSAVFDQLISKFVNKGLSSLGSAINPNEPKDEWSYNGLTLGGSSTVGGYGDPWDAGPDEIVTVADLKLKLDDDIDMTEEEIKYMTNDVPDSFGPGTMQALAQIWPKVQELDACQPGPDIKWQERLDGQMYAAQSKLLVPGYDGAGGEREELEYATGVFKDWLRIQLKNALPSSASFMDSIENLPDLSQQAIQLGSKIDSKTDTLTQLKLIKAKLDTLLEEPVAGSEDERTLVSLWTQHKAIAGDIASDITLGTTRSERDTAIAKRDNVSQLLIACREERTAKGWEAPGGAESKLAAGGATEQNYFCDWPIVGGFSHKNFINPAEPAYPQIPLVNATGIQIGTSSVDINMNCGTIFNANILDYKGDLPSF